MGINDLRKDSPFGDLYAILNDTTSAQTAEEKIAAWLMTFDESNYTTFEQAYALAIMNMLNKYKGVEIWCATLVYTNEDVFSAELLLQYNYCIKALASYFGCNVADLENGYVTAENCHAYTSDTGCLHPTPYGHELMERFIIEAWYEALQNN